MLEKLRQILKKPSLIVQLYFLATYFELFL